MPSRSGLVFVTGLAIWPSLAAAQAQVPAPPAAAAGHRVVVIEQLGAAVPETIGAHVEGGVAKLAVGDVIPPGRTLRVDLPGVIVKLHGASPGAAGSEDYVIDCTERTCPARFTPSAAGRTQRGGRVLTQVKDLLKRWVLDVWSPGSDKPVNVAVEGTTFAVDTANGEGQFDVTVAEGVVTVTVSGGRPLRVANGRRAYIGAGGVLSEAAVDRATTTRIRERFTEVVIRERRNEVAGYGLVDPGGSLRERNIQVERVRVVQETIASGATAAEQAAILARWRKEGRRVITTAQDALSAGDAAYRDAFGSAAALDVAPEVQNALDLFQLAASLARPGTRLHAQATANAGLCLLDLSKFAEADTALTQAVGVLPTEPVVLGALSRLYGDRRWSGWNLIRANEFSSRHLNAAKGKGAQLKWAGTNALRLWRFQDATRAFQDAEPLLRASGDLNGAGWALLYLGDATRDLATYAEAADAYKRAARAFEDEVKLTPASLDAQRDLSVALDRVADGLRAQGRTAESLALYQRSLALAERLATAQPGRTLWQDDLAISLSAVGHRLESLGRTADALPLYQRSLAIRTRLAAAGAPEGEESLTFAMNDVASVLEQQGRTREALQLYENSLAIRERLAKAAPSDQEAQALLASSLNLVAGTQQSLGRVTDAVALYTRSLGIRERQAAADPRVITAQRDVASSLMRVAGGLQLLGRPAEALRHYERSLTLRERLSAGDPGRTDLQQELSRTLDAIAEVMREQGDAAGALARYEQSLALRERLVGSEPERTSGQLGLTDTLTSLGVLLEENGRTVEAQGYLDRAVAILDRLTVAEPTRLDLQAKLAYTVLRASNPPRVTGRRSEALARAQRALDITRKLTAAEPMRADFQQILIDAIEAVSSIGILTGMDPKQRIALCEEGVNASERLAKAEPGLAQLQQNWTQALESLASVLSSDNRRVEAIARYGQSLAIADQLVAAHPERPEFRRQLSEVLTSYALVLDIEKRTAEALPHVERSVAISRGLTAGSPNHVRYQFGLSANLRSLGAILWGLDRRAEALARYEESVSVAQQLAVKHPDRASVQSMVSFTLDALGNAFVRLKRDSEALPKFETSLGISERLLATDPQARDLKLDVGRTANALAELHLRARRMPEAQAKYERFVEVATSMVDDTMDEATVRFVARALQTLSLVLRAQGRDAQGLTRYEESLSLQARVLDTGKPYAALRLDYAQALQYAAGLHVRADHPAEARDRLVKAIAIFEQLAQAAPKDGEAASRVAGAQIDLSGLVPRSEGQAVLERALGHLRAFDTRSSNTEGWCLILLGRFAEARDVLAAALQRTPPTQEEYPYLQGNLAHTYLLEGKADEALDLYRKILPHPEVARGTMDDFADFTKRGFPTAGFDRARAVLSGK